MNKQTPDLQELPLKMKTTVDYSRVFSYECCGPATQYWVLRPET